MFIKTYISLRHDINYCGNDICEFSVFSVDTPNHPPRTLLSSTMTEAFGETRIMQAGYKNATI